MRIVQLNEDELREASTKPLVPSITVHDIEPGCVFDTGLLGPDGEPITYPVSEMQPIGFIHFK